MIVTNSLNDCLTDYHGLFLTICPPGWTLDSSNHDLLIDWLTLPPAPRALLDLLSCDCKTGCKDARCSCLRNGLPCTDACRCRHCVSDVACSNTIPNDDLAAASDEVDLSDILQQDPVPSEETST